MEKYEIIKNIAQRTGGDIYLGVVGAVRTGKSTFIKKMVETLVVPYIEDEYEKKRTLDEIPQSAAGKTIMTTEPKFIPNRAAKVKIDDFDCNIRLVDCVGFVIDNAKGATDENGPRMVKTPWYDEEIPFTEVIVTEVGAYRMVPAEKLGSIFRKYTKQPVTEISSVEEAFDEAYARKGDGILFCVGSLYLVGSLKEILRSRKNA